MKTSSERVAAHRAKRLAEGWAIVHCQIPPDAARCLAGLVHDRESTRAEVVADALRAYYGTRPN